VAFFSSLIQVHQPMNPYIPVLFILIFALVFGGIMSALSALVGPKKFSKVKFEPYECGVPAVGTRDKMSVKFYLTAILFILFDIETVFLYLWATTFRDLGWFGIIEVLIFLVILVVGYVYVLKRGALEWE
jgi:NADH-quinone oxidoreductase subunit A